MFWVLNDVKWIISGFSSIVMTYWPGNNWFVNIELSQVGSIIGFYKQYALLFPIVLKTICVVLEGISWCCFINLKFLIVRPPPGPTIDQAFYSRLSTPSFRLAWQSCPAQGPMPPHTPNDFRVILDERVCSDPWSFKKSTSVTGPLHRLQWGKTHLNAHNATICNGSFSWGLTLLTFV